MKLICSLCLALVTLNVSAWQFTASNISKTDLGNTVWYIYRHTEPIRGQWVHASLYIWVAHNYESLEGVDITFGNITTMSTRYQLTPEELVFEMPGLSVYGPTDKFWNRPKSGKWNFKVNNSDVEILGFGVASESPVAAVSDSAGGLVSLAAVILGLILWRRVT